MYQCQWLLPLVGLLILAEPVHGQSQNPCHLNKKLPAKNCSVVTLPKGFCSACQFGGYDNRGFYTDCTKTFNIDFNDEKCMDALQSYVNLNSCDDVRAANLADFKASAGANEVARQGLDYYYYSVCEEGCDCVPQEHGDRNNPALDVYRGNCQAHAYYDICQVLPSIELVHLEGTPAAAPGTLPKACPLFVDWFRSPAAVGWRSKSYTPAVPAVKYFLERITEAEQLLTNLDYFQGCFDLETAQNRVDEISTSDFYVAGQQGTSTSQFFLVIPSPTNSVLQPSLFDYAIIDMNIHGSSFNIKFNPSVSSVVRVVFYVDDVQVRSEGTAPYALAGDNPPGNYNPWKPASGSTYRVKAQGLDSRGTVVETKVISLSFCSGCSSTCSACPPPTLAPSTTECNGICDHRLAERPPGADMEQFELVDASTNALVSPPLFDFVVVDKAVFGRALNIQFTPAYGQAGSVKFLSSSRYNDIFETVENVAPYALKGDVRGNFRAWDPPDDMYSIFAFVYGAPGAQGPAMESHQINVQICDGCYAHCECE